LKDWVAQTLPRTTTTVGEWIEKSYGVSYTRSALLVSFSPVAAHSFTRTARTRRASQ
jgi:hypothetical protein